MSVDLDYIKASDGTGEAVRATVTAARSVGATTLQVDSTINFPAKFIATSGSLNLETGVLNPVGIQVFLGSVSGASLTINSFAPGYSDIGHTVGQVVLIKPATVWVDKLVEFLGVTHNTDGTINSSTVTSLAASLTTPLLGSNKEATSLKIKPRIYATTSATTLTPNLANYNQYTLSAQSANLTIANPTTGYVDGDIIILNIKDNGTSRAISYGSLYLNISGLSTLTATVAGKWHTMGLRYNAAAVKWHIISISTGA